MSTVPVTLRRSPRRHTPPDASPKNSPEKPDSRAHERAGLSALNVERRLSMTPQINEDLDLIDLAPSEMSSVFTFLSRQNRVVLRNIGRKWNRRGTGNKKEFLYRNILYLLDGKKAGRDVAVMLNSNEACPSFEKFLKKAEEDSLSFSFQQCPSEAVLRNHLRSVGDPEDGTTVCASRSSGNPDTEEANSGAPHFSISEFARLFVRLRDDHICKQALLRLTQDLKRADFEAGRTRQSFWQEIEKRFNDHSLQYHQSFEGFVPEADPAATPLCYRKFDVLKTQLHNARKSFTAVDARYTQSGQNDPEKWPDFLTKGGNGDFIATSKRSYIIFVVCKLAQEYGQEMFLLNATKKTFSGGDDEGPEEEAGTGSSGSKRKRTSSDAFNAVMDKRWADLQSFIEETKEQGKAIQNSVTTRDDSIANTLADVTERNSVLQMLTSAYKTYTEAQSIGADPTLVGFLKANYDRVLKKYSDLEKGTQQD